MSAGRVRRDLVGLAEMNEEDVRLNPLFHDRPGIEHVRRREEPEAWAGASS